MVIGSATMNTAAKDMYIDLGHMEDDLGTLEDCFKAMEDDL